MGMFYNNYRDEMKKLIMVVFAAAAISGCAQQSFSVNPGGGADKVVRTEVQQTFVNGLLGFVTLGIYTPREARVYCAK